MDQFPIVNPLKLSLNDFIIAKEDNSIHLGKGTFAEVFKATHK